MEHAEGSRKCQIPHNIEAEEVEPGRGVDRFARGSGDDSLELMGDIYHACFVSGQSYNTVTSAKG